MSPRPRPGEQAVVALQGHLMRINGVDDAATPDIRPFLVDDEMLEKIRPPTAERAADEWVLVRQEDDNIDIAVWIDSAHLEQLAQYSNPAIAVSDALRSFCAAVEGISHFLFLIERARRNEPLTLLEMEVQAEIDKFMSARMASPGSSAGLHRVLFEGSCLQPGLSAEEAERYREATRLARAWCRHLDRLPHIAAMLDAQRRFYRAPGSRRLDCLRRLAA